MRIRFSAGGQVNATGFYPYLVELIKGIYNVID